MTQAANQELSYVLRALVSVLVVATAAGFVSSLTSTGEAVREVAETLNVRIRSWWVMSIVVAAAYLTGSLGALVLFFAISFMALREIITLTPTKPADHQALFLTFFIATPLQYVLLAVQWYGLFTVLIPVYAFLLIPTFSAIAGDPDEFLDRVAKIQWGLMVCVYCVSYAPALMMLAIPGYQGHDANLLLYLVVVDQSGGAVQYVWGKLVGRRQFAASISPNKTWEGLVGGIGSATLIGTALWGVTPFNPWQAGLMSLAIALMGFSGRLTMSAIKRGYGVNDYGGVIPGRGGIMDRIDSLCFAAPVFFHLTRYFFT